MTKQKLLLYLLFLMGMVQSVMAQEPYAVLSENNTKLTFYYDKQKATRNGMSVGPFENIKDRGWNSQCSTITTVVFDASFADCTSLTSTFGWFYYCSKLASISGIENLKTDNVTNMSYMFEGCESLTSLDVSGFKTDNVKNMSEMFEDCESLTSLDVSGFKTDNVTDMSFMFEGCESLTSLDVSGFKTDNVTDMSFMFEGCESLTSLDVSGFKNDKVTNMSSMFFSCYNLTSLDLSGFKTDNVTYMSHMFRSCYNLTSLDLSGFKTDNVTTMSGMFWGCESLTSLDVRGFKTDNVKNMSEMFWGCESLTSLDLSGFKTDNVTTMRCMFEGCSSLTSLDVRGFKTDNVKNMSEMFWGCESLTSLDLSGFKTDNVTTMSGMFWGCSSLTSLDVSSFKTDNVTDMSQMFWACSGLTSLDLSGFKTDNVTTMRCMFGGCSGLTSLDVSGFKTGNVTRMDLMFEGCSKLTTIYASDGWNTDKVEDYGIMFADCAALVGGNGTMYNDAHTNYEYARIDLPGQPGYFTEKITSFALNATVTDGNGNDITQDVNIMWYDGDGKQIGTGSKLNGVTKDAEVYYSILLPEPLGRVYREVNMRKANADEDGAVKCQLEKIGRVTLEGRVSATDIDKTTLTVSVRQMLNGKWAQDYSAQTDRQGLFSIEVYDDATDITISGDGYLDATLHRDGFGSSGNVGTIPVNLLTGFAIAANVSMEKAVATGEASEVTAWTDGLTNIDFVLTNLTKGTTLTDIAVQGGNVVIRSGAAAGDEISLKAVSKQGVFADAETTFTLAEGANSFELQLTELGGVDATYTASNNGTTVGYLYDHNDLLAARGSYKGETLSLRHLKSGTYTLVSMGQSLLLGSMTSLDDLNAVGLRDGTDYVATRIDIVDGELAAVSVSDVPHLDETPFYYTTGNTYFNAGKASVTAGNYITLLTHIDLKPEHTEKAGGVTLTVDLPEGCSMVENSAIANRQAVPHTVSGNRVTMTLAKEQYESEVRFCVIPTLNQSYTVTAMATFDIDGQVQQPIGTAQFEAKGLSLSAPELTHSTTVTINGTAKGHSEVRIYDNDVLVGTTTSKADGTWTAQCELYKPYSHSFHDIYAKIITEDGMELTSETKLVEYDKTNIVPSSVMMTYYNGWYMKNIDVMFDLQNGTTSPSSYPFYSATDFTFLADFTRNDSTVVKNVNIKVLNSDGTVRSLPATFDGKQGKWVATTKYSSSNRLPQNVQVEYDVIPAETPIDSALIQDDINQYMSLVDTYMSNLDSTKVQVVDKKDGYVVCTYQTYAMDVPIYVKVETINDESKFNEISRKQYFEYYQDDMTICMIDSVVGERHALWLWTPTERNMYCITFSAENDFNATHQVNGPKRGFREVVNLFGRSVANLFCNAGDIAMIIRQYNESYNDLQNWLLKYNQLLDNQMRMYYRTKELMEAKCPDGSLRLNQQSYAQSRLNECLHDASEMRANFKAQLDLVEQDLVRRRNAMSMLSATKALCGAAIRIAGIAGNLTLAGVIGSNVLLSNATGLYTWLMDSQWHTTETLSNWYFPASSIITQEYLDLQSFITNAYKKCEKKEEEDEEEKQDEPVEEKSENKAEFKGNGTTPIIDPSGYVYEAVLSNRLEGVTTTCYEQVNGSAVLWNAEDYSQQNPLKTDATGFYRWDVPQGMWQVKYEKEGYETAYSEWLPVPPPQLDVNIGMKQSTPPTVKEMRGYEEGITIEMGKYMRPETMTAERITVTRNGSPESGSIAPLNTEQEPLGEQTYVSKVRFVPETAFNSSDVVVVTVHKEVESYCGVQMKADHVETVKIEAEVKSIVADETISVPYQGERELRVVVLPKDAAAGKTLRIRNSSQMIATVDASEVVIGKDGAATLTVGGSLPGGAVLDFAIDGSDVTWTTKVQVVMGRDMVAMPTTNIASGETVGDGTMLALSCTTPGATIYYTLDGSCPCDEATRIKYEAPIAITESVVVKAIAVKEGMDDSDVATFIYMLTGIRSSKLDGQIQMECHNGTLTITGAKGANCQIYDLGGRELTSRSNMDSEATFHLKAADVCLVHIRQKDGQSAVYKIQVR